MNNTEKFDLIIEPNHLEKNYWRDLWRYRELFYILAWRDVKVRYKQTVLGVAWSIIRPFLTMVIFTLIFSKLAKLPSEGTAPYSVLVFAAMLPWQFFANSLQESSNSMIGNVNLITKVYFPRIIIPISTVIVSLLDFLISLTLLMIMMIWYSYLPPIQILLIPLFLLLAFITSFGIGIFITALNVKYRDFRYIVPFIVQFGLYISPVGFSSSIVPEKFRLIYSLNPMVGIIDGFRWCIIGYKNDMLLISLALSSFVSITISFFALKYFRKTEKQFADII
jgi:lipopolysaccharide transport system permease protein